MLLELGERFSQRSFPDSSFGEAVGAFNIRNRYVRLHGRNYKEWFSSKADGRQRYDFLYRIEQLEPWVDRIRKISETRDTYIVTNNHNLEENDCQRVRTYGALRNHQEWATSVPHGGADRAIPDGD